MVLEYTPEPNEHLLSFSAVSNSDSNTINLAFSQDSNSWPTPYPICDTAIYITSDLVHGAVGKIKRGKDPQSPVTIIELIKASSESCTTKMND